MTQQEKLEEMKKNLDMMAITMRSVALRLRCDAHDYDVQILHDYAEELETTAKRCEAI